MLSPTHTLFISLALFLGHITGSPVPVASKLPTSTVESDHLTLAAPEISLYEPVDNEERIDTPPIFEGRVANWVIHEVLMRNKKDTFLLLQSTGDHGGALWHS